MPSSEIRPTRRPYSVPSRAVLVPCAAILALLVGACGRRSAEVATPPNDVESAAIVAYLAQLDEDAKRTNGVLLTACAELKDKAILIKWALEYDGPRAPLIILEPVFPVCLYDATRIRVVNPEATTQEASAQIPWEVLRDGSPWPIAKAGFLRVEKGEKATGQFLIPLEKVRRALVAQWPELRNRPLPPRVYIQVMHSPSARGFGEERGNDAWTGRLFTRPMKVTNINW